MAPRKNDRPVVATRRSGRIASRAGSVASSNQEEKENKSGLYHPNILPSTASSKLQSRVVDAVNSVTGQKVTARSNSRVTKNKKSKSVKSVYSTITLVTGAQRKALGKAPVPEFDVLHAIGRILMDRKQIQKLTEAQKDAVINAFADREVHYKLRVDAAERRANELEAELAAARAEAEKIKMKSKTPMRDAMFQQSLRKRREQTPASSDTPSRAISSTTFQSPAVPSVTRDTTFITDSTDFSHADLITGTPAPAKESQSQQQQPDENATPKSRTSIFGSFFKTITTPFLSRRKSQEGSTPQQSPHETLGELPASRKRSAPAPAEPSTYTQPRLQGQATQQSAPAPVQQSKPERLTESRSTPRNASTSSAQKTARTFTVPSSKNPLQETSLATITEHTEVSEQSTIGSRTPLKAPTPLRAPRSIAAVRRAQQTPSRTSSTPTRVWSQPPPPRDTNADRRLDKLRKFQELNNELKAMKEDEELQQMTERPLKRVKIDSLVKIPARRPGESSGTFRVFDVDSDDEMEVDADEAVRSNIFEQSTTEDTSVAAVSKSVASTPAVEKQATSTTTPPTPAVAKPTPAPAPAPVAPAPVAKAPAVKVVPEVPAMTFKFPDVGLLAQGTNDMNNAYLGAMFAYGLEHWKVTGETLPLF